MHELNETFFEEDPFTEDQDTDLDHETIHRLVLLAITIINLVTLIIDIFTIRIFQKNKDLCTRLNMYIVHFLIWNIVNNIFRPTFIILHIAVYGTIFVDEDVHFIIDNIDQEIHCIHFKLIVAMLIDWFIMCTRLEINSKFTLIYGNIIKVIYFMSFLKCCVTITLSFLGYGPHLSEFNIRFVYSVSFLILLLIVTSRYIKERSYNFDRDNYIYQIAIYYLVFYLPIYLYTLCRYFITGSNKPLYILEFAIPAIIARFGPIVMFIIMFKHNKQFRVCLKTIFKKLDNAYGVFSAAEVN